MNKTMFDTLTEYRRGIPEPLMDTAAVLTYEAGRVLENAMYHKWDLDRNDPTSAKVRIGYLKSELIDVIAQCQLICESLGCDFEEMRQMGVEKAMERFTRKEVKK